MIMATYERIREIGLMKAVGARNRDVMFMFLAEAGAIDTLGGIGEVAAGWLLGLVSSLVGRSYLTSMALQSGVADFEAPSLAYTPVWLMIFAMLFATPVGVLSGVYPVLRATRLDPIATLRYEKRDEMNIAYAIKAGTLKENAIPDEVWPHLEGPLGFYRDSEEEPNYEK
jgi:putative ABC transport system permease protein